MIIDVCNKNQFKKDTTNLKENGGGILYGRFWKEDSEGQRIIAY